MRKEGRGEIPGITTGQGTTNELMVPFTYGCNQCPVKTECGPFLHIQETPRAIRGKLAGTEDCLIVTDDRWTSDIQVLEPRKIR